MSSGRASFEVQVQSDERWTIENQFDSEEAARASAKVVAGKRMHQAVRIIKYWQRADGGTTETVILQQAVGIAEAKVTPSPIEDAPYCKKLRDYYSADSRETIGRLLRKYLEKVILTPTELIHSSKALKRVQEVDTLFPPAVDRVAALQAKAAQEDSRARRDEIFKAITQMTQRARRTEEIPNLPKLRRNDLAQMLGEIEKLAPPAESEYYALVVLSGDLMQHNNWLAKLERLASLTTPDLSDQTLSLLDGVQPGEELGVFSAELVVFLKGLVGALALQRLAVVTLFAAALAALFVGFVRAALVSGHVSSAVCVVRAAPSVVSTALFWFRVVVLLLRRLVRFGGLSRAFLERDHSSAVRLFLELHLVSCIHVAAPVHSQARMARWSPVTTPLISLSFISANMISSPSAPCSAAGIETYQRSAFHFGTRSTSPTCAHTPSGHGSPLSRFLNARGPTATSLAIIVCCASAFRASSGSTMPLLRRGVRRICTRMRLPTGRVCGSTSGK